MQEDGEDFTKFLLSIALARVGPERFKRSALPMPVWRNILVGENQCSPDGGWRMGMPAGLWAGPGSSLFSVECFRAAGWRRNPRNIPVWF